MRICTRKDFGVEFEDLLNPIKVVRYPGVSRGEGRRGGIMNPGGGFKGRKRSGGGEGPVRAGVVKA